MKYKISLYSIIVVLLLNTAYAKLKELVIPGTGDSSQILKILSDDFSKINKNIKILIPPSIGSSGGIKGLVEKKFEIARVAGDQSKKINKFKLKYTKFADSPIVFAIHKSVKNISQLSESQIKQLYSGEIKFWHEISKSQKGKKVYLLGREKGDSSRKTIQKAWPDFKTTQDSKTVFSTDELKELLTRHPFTLGYLPFSRLPKECHLLVINQEDPKLYIRKPNYKYKLTVPFGLVYKDNLSAPAKMFLKYLSSDRAKKLLIKNRVRPL